MNVYAALAQQYTLDDMKCLSSVTRKSQLESLADKGYLFGLTKSDWQKRFPSIPPERIFCQKSTLFVADLLYFDEDRCICFHTNIMDGRSIMGDDNATKAYMDKVKGDLEAAYARKDYSLLLSPLVSEEGGNMVMDMLQRLLLREEPSAALYDVFLSNYTFCNNGAGKLGLEAFERLEACKDEKLKNRTSKKLAKLPEELTIYRGEGSQSVPYTSAYSWTLKKERAFYFASWRGGEDARIITAKVDKAAVLEYVTDRNEDEILVHPQRVQNIQIENMVTLPYFLNVVDRAKYGGISLTGLDAHSLADDVASLYREHFSNIEAHDATHTAHVLLFASFIYREIVLADRCSGLSRKQAVADYKTLLRAAEWHDIGRINDKSDSKHGAKSYKLYAEEVGEDAELEYLLTYHCRDDKEAQLVCESDFPDGRTETIWQLLCILKDADALDRCRFGMGGKDGLSVSMLRTEEALRMVPMANAFQKYRL